MLQKNINNLPDQVSINDDDNNTQQKTTTRLNKRHEIMAPGGVSAFAGLGTGWDGWQSAGATLAVRTLAARSHFCASSKAAAMVVAGIDRYPDCSNSNANKSGEIPIVVNKTDLVSSDCGISHVIHPKLCSRCLEPCGRQFDSIVCMNLCQHNRKVICNAYLLKYLSGNTKHHQTVQK